MIINRYFCGELDYSFTDDNVEEVEDMKRLLNDPENDIVEFYTEDDHCIVCWPMDAQPEEPDIRSVSYGDYGARNPWDAPGMSPSDFFR